MENWILDEDKNLADKYKTKHLQIYENGKSVSLLYSQSGFWILIECCVYFIISCDMLGFPSEKYRSQYSFPF